MEKNIRKSSTHILTHYSKLTEFEILLGSRNSNFSPMNLFNIVYWQRRSVQNLKLFRLLHNRRSVHDDRLPLSFLSLNNSICIVNVLIRDFVNKGLFGLFASKSKSHMVIFYWIPTSFVQNRRNGGILTLSGKVGGVTVIIQTTGEVPVFVRNLRGGKCNLPFYFLFFLLPF